MKKLRVYILIALVLTAFVLASPVVARADSERVRVGGFPIGISLDVGGLLIESVTGVETEYGTAYVDGLMRGDVIKSIDGTPVTDIDGVRGALGAGPADILLVRGGEEMTVTVTPLIEAYTGSPKLGVRIKDRLYGIGTVTFVRESGEYAALGHEIYDSDTGAHIPFCGGCVHPCRILGIKRGERGEAGALLGTLALETDAGTVTCNNSFGIAGKYTGSSAGELMELCSRAEVHPGAARILTTIDDRPEYFDIEIIKASHRAGRAEKGIVFRVTDKRLLEKTGGVVRGMSGSPIIQNGKIAGAVTHVILGDFTKGYGVYADCLN